MPQPVSPDAPHVVIIPVKPPQRGKSRLSELPDELRVALATAFALDVVQASLSCDAVRATIMVTDDYRLAAQVEALGCRVIPDGASEDLNESLIQAAHEAWRLHPEAAVAAICADLPCLRAEDLSAALHAAPPDRPSFVADANGDGTSLYAAPHPDLFAPAFGPLSAARHLQSGAVAIEGGLMSLRSDVDSPGDLGRAMVLGLGPHTADVMGAHAAR